MISNFLPNWAEPPGGTLEDVLRERRMTVPEFAHSIGRPTDMLEQLIAGSSAVDEELALKFESKLGIPATFWLALERQYRSDLSRLNTHEKSDLEREAWVRRLPYSEMLRFGWLNEAAGTEPVARCLEFFGVSSVRAWEAGLARTLAAAPLRTSPTFESNDAAMFAWLRYGEIQAEKHVTRQWDASGFRAALPTMRELTRKADPDVFLPRLQHIAAEHGVAVVVAKAPSGCKASGATRFLENGGALLLLSFRYLTDDHFWFTFFHEAGHLLLHSHESTFLEENDPGDGDEMEMEANSFAADLLVPPPLREELLSLPPKHKEVMRFARRIGVSSGIVVGQMQHYGVLERSWLNGLKRRFAWTSED